MQFEIGSTVYLRGDMGDYYEGQSVIVPANTPGRIIEFEEDQGFKYARIEIPTSPGQKRLRTIVTELDITWTLTPRPTVWTHIQNNISEIQ
jgi:hypothetical protein